MGDEQGLSEDAQFKAWMDQRAPEARQSAENRNKRIGMSESGVIASQNLEREVVIFISFPKAGILAKNNW